MISVYNVSIYQELIQFLILVDTLKKGFLNILRILKE